MTMGVSQEYEAQRCEEYQARYKDNFNALLCARTTEERRAIEDLIVEDYAAHVRLSNEERQSLHQYLHETAAHYRWMGKWGWPLVLLPMVLAAVFVVVFTGKRRAWAWTGLALAAGSAAISVAYLTGSLPV